MILGSRVELAGRVKLQISGGARGTIDYPWQDNMILDQGFVQLITGSGSVMDYFSVGGSSQPVSPTDTGLISPIARVYFGTESNGWNETEGFGWSRMVKTFARGVAAGNISELSTGLEGNNTSAAARTLVRDGEGNPTTITVLSDEVLTMTWEWRRWWTVADPHVIEFDVDGESRSVMVSYSAMGAEPESRGCNRGMSASLISSTGGEFVGEFKQTYAENAGNPQVGSVSSLGDSNSGGFNGSVFPHNTAYATFDPPIAKTDEFRLEIRHRVALTRRAP